MRPCLARSTLFLLLLAGLSGQNYWGAELRTLDTFQYGRFETSLQPPAGEGFLASFFTYNDSFPASDWAEIDFEVLGRWPDNIDVNVIDENGSHLRQHPVDFNVHVGFHRYAIEWTPSYVAWFLDGEEFYRQEGQHIAHLDQPGKLMMNIWTPNFVDWVGQLDDRTLPRYARYDWASYAAYTPGSGSVGTDQNFSPVWVDSFDTFIDTLWEKSDGHTWAGNNSFLMAENIVYENGNMILCLTEPNLGGIQDDSSPPVALWARAHTLDSVIVRYSEWLDPVSAGNAATFVIPGKTILSADLNEDHMTVSLKLASDLTASTSVYALGLADMATPPNVQMGSGTLINLPQPLELPVRIDVAGPGRQGFLPDQPWSPSVEYGHEGGNYQVLNSFPDLDNTDLDSVMATSLNRYSRYHVRLQPGVFDLSLHFAEHYYGAAGERTFDLYIEDSLIVSALDVYQMAGNTAVYTLQLHNLEITDGILNILGAAVVYGETYAYAGPVLNAIEIEGEYTVGVEGSHLPDSYGLQQVYPNPFNGQTRIEFALPVSELVTLTLYDIRGVAVKQIMNRSLTAGNHVLRLNASGLSSGVYILQYHAADLDQSRKILHLK
jgi:hypothetical protein